MLKIFLALIFFIVPLTASAQSQNFSLDGDHGKFSARDNLPRLHGQSDGSFQDMTVPNEIEDAKKIFKYARRLPNVTSISIAGHSQGGVVASMVAGELGAKKIKPSCSWLPLPSCATMPSAEICSV